jgi:hypothetical protein
MISAFITFLGGSVFRMLWGEISHWLTSRQEHVHELDRMRLEGELAAAQHARQQEAIKTQAAIGIQVIEAQAVANVQSLEAEGWLSAVQATSKAVGIAFVDGWNAVIRPGVATWSVIMITLGEFGAITLSPNALAVASAALGIYLAERNLLKRGK